jgi:hypothetical protein
MVCSQSLNPDPVLLDELYILPNVTVPAPDDTSNMGEEELERQLHLNANCVPGPELKPGEIVTGDSPKYVAGQPVTEGTPVLISTSAAGKPATAPVSAAEVRAY